MNLLKTQDTSSPSPVETVTYSYGGGSHRIHLLAKMSPDLVLMQQAKLVAFFLKTGSAMKDIVIDPVPRKVKDLLRTT